MKVLFIPENKGNPYQKILDNSLSKEGIDVNFGIYSYPFPVLRSVKNYWRVDILHIHWPHPFLISINRGITVLKSSIFISELIILKLLGIKIVWTVHNIASHEANFRSLELFFTKLLTRLCNRIIVHTPFAKNEVINTYGVESSLITVIPHGNYINYYENVIDKAQARKQLQISIEDLVFLYFGRIKPYKGVPELINAFKKLNYSQVKLLIAGKPLNNEIASNIVEKCNGDRRIKAIFKLIPDNELQIYMNAADVVVLPYRDILTSGAVTLAMSFGKPIIAPAIGCIPDLLDSEGSFLYGPSEEDGLVKAMKKALTCELKKMGEHNFELAKQLRWDEIARKTHDVYQECLSRKDKASKRKN